METKRLIQKRLFFIILLIFLFISCATPRYNEMGDQELMQKWRELSYGRSIAHDVIWSGGFMTLKYSKHRAIVAGELEKRDYKYDGHNWIKKDVQPSESQVVPPEKSTKPVSVTPSSKQSIVTVTWTFANVRSGAGNDYPSVATVKQGEKLIVIGEIGDWLNVRLEDGKEGWISNEVVK